MNAFVTNLFRRNPILAGYIGVGPILLLSNRLIYALVFSAFYLAYFSLLTLIFWIVDRYLEETLRFAAKLIFAAVLIAVGDMIVGAILPLIRADIGILFPLILSATYLYLPLFPGQEESGGVGSIYGNLLGFTVVFILIAITRELLAFGAIDLNPYPWNVNAPGPTSLLIFSSGFGLLFILAFGKALVEKAQSQKDKAPAAEEASE